MGGKLGRTGLSATQLPWRNHMHEPCTGVDSPIHRLDQETPTSRITRRLELFNTTVVPSAFHGAHRAIAKSILPTDSPRVVGPVRLGLGKDATSLDLSFEEGEGLRLPQVSMRN
jgi:hypothetical protein